MPEFQPQVAPEHYESMRYITKERFISYWHQIDEVTRLSPASVLEIGIGNGFVKRFLQERGVAIKSADADARLKPDVVAVLPSLPFQDNAFEVACCFEVLEHIPFSEFDACVREIKRVTSRWVLLSLPDVTPYARMRLEWGFKRTLFRRFFDIGRCKLPSHTFDGEHYWEIGKEGTPLSLVSERLRGAGFADVSTFRVEEDPWHRFFRCRVA